MSSKHHQRVKEIFLIACEQPQERLSEYLDEACSTDEALRKEVEALLDLDRSVTLSPGGVSSVDRIGNFRLLHKLGEGGMGEVWEAEQEQPVRRRVAFKLIKWGMDTKEVLARFESERQALALMSHPNIAKAYEAGSTDEGKPFFAMEYVDGIPLTEYCDLQRLSTRERLTLFMQVCEGVQHAHRNGIIHRDIKPSNILVATEDGRPAAKIIDFGVAKATSQRLTERTLFTELGQWIGTPEYMSPEQAGLAGLEVDTRSDVYSLGVVLYELLAGSQPFDSCELRTVGFDEIRRRIREEEPPKPSTRVSSLGDASRVAAERRRTDTHKLAKTLRGDLDWIVMKALDKDRARRYPSPFDLATDIERYLKHEPVEASPPSALYRTRKLVLRHRLGFTAGLLVLAALIAGIIGTSVGLSRARTEAANAERVSRLLASVFTDLDPVGEIGVDSSPPMMLGRGVERIRNELADQPVVRARLLEVIGSVYRNLGRFDEARPLLEESLALREAHLGSTHTAVADTCVSLGWLEFRAARHQKSLWLFERAVAIFELNLGSNHRSVATSLGFLGGVRQRTGSYEAARADFERSLAIFRTIRMEHDPAIINTIYPFAVMMMEMADYEAAQPLLEQALALSESQHGADHPTTGWLLADLGSCFMGTLKYDRARPLLERALQIQEHAFGPDHPNLMPPLTKLAVLDRQERRFESAWSQLERALAIGERSLGPDHPDLVWTLGPYALALQQRGDSDGARAMLERALLIAERSYGQAHVEVARIFETSGFHHYLMEEYVEALREYRRAFEIKEKVFGSKHPASGWNLYDQACILALQGDAATALETLRRALEHGWASARILADDDFDSLRGDPAFDDLLDEVRARLRP